MQFAEEVREFLIESHENLGTLDREIVALEKKPEDAELIASVFRTIHTIKGTCGFFGFGKLGAITHVAEHILGQVRAGERKLTPELVSLTLQTVDAVREILVNIEATGEEGQATYDDLRQRLEEASKEGFGVTVAMPETFESTGVQDEVRDDVAPANDGAGAAKVIVTEVERKSGGGSNSECKATTIRVDVSLLDKLMNLVGELVLARNQILLRDASRPETNSDTSQRLNLITSELQEGVMRARMQPISVVWNKLPRVVRDLASQLSKQIEVQMQGAETDLDKTIIEAIKDPLIHIVRNSCDHGIETPDERIRKGKSACGTIKLRAYHEGGHVNIEISDDGAGLDPEKLKNKAVQKNLIRPEQVAQMSEREALRLIFLPGFSTAETLTNISGRGVGMDVVKTNIEKIGGSIDLQTRIGFGSTIKIKIPLTLAIIPGLVVTLGGHRFVIPQANLLELVRLEGHKECERVRNISGTEVYHRRGRLLPLVYLNQVLGLPPREQKSEAISIVIVHAEEIAFGLIVDGISDTQEIVVKALGRQLKRLSCYFGATVMGDGKIALILDISGLARLAGIAAQQSDATKKIMQSAGAEVGESEGERQTLLLFSAGRFRRLVVPLSLVARLEDFPRSRIESASGFPVLNYCGAILPLVSMGRLLDPSLPDSMMDRESLQVIVFSEGNQRVGLVVDEILDIVDESVTVKRASSSFGLLGSGVVGGKVTDFVDMGALLEAVAVSFPEAPVGDANRKLLLADSSKMMRGALRSYLEMNGHRVIEAGSTGEALEVLLRTPVSMVITGLDTQGSGPTLLDLIKSNTQLCDVPVLGLVERASDLNLVTGGGRRFDECLLRNERGALLQSIQRLGIGCTVPILQEPEMDLARSAR